MINNRIFQTILSTSAVCYMLTNGCFADKNLQKVPGVITPSSNLPSTVISSPITTSAPTTTKKHHHHRHSDKAKHQKSLSSGNVWTLESAIQKTLQNHPEISGYAAAQRAAEMRIGSAKAGYLPTLDLRTAAGYDYTRDQTRTNKINQGVTGTVARGDHFEPSLTLEQPLFDGFETVNQVKKAQKEHVQAGLKIDESKVLLAYRVAEQYIALRRFQRLLKLAQENVANHRQVSGKIETLVKAGKLTIVEREQVLSRLTDAESAVADIEGDVDNAIANFVELVGEIPTALSKVHVPIGLLPTTLQQALQIAYKNNRSLMLARSTVDVAKSDMDVTKSAFYPKLGIEIDAVKRYDVAAKDGTENNLTALLVLRWNLFNGGRDKAKTAEYKERILQAYHDMKKEQRAAEKEVRVSWGELKSSARQAKSLRLAASTKKQLVDAYMAEFNIGKKSLLDILDAFHEFFLAKGSLITADSTYDLAALRIMAAAGELLSLLGIKSDMTTQDPSIIGDVIPQVDMNPDDIMDSQSLAVGQHNHHHKHNVRSDPSVDASFDDNLPKPEKLTAPQLAATPKSESDNDSYGFPDQDHMTW